MIQYTRQQGRNMLIVHHVGCSMCTFQLGSACLSNHLEWARRSSPTIMGHRGIPYKRSRSITSIGKSLSKSSLQYGVQNGGLFSELEISSIHLTNLEWLNSYLGEWLQMIIDSHHLISNPIHSRQINYL